MTASHWQEREAHRARGVVAYRTDEVFDVWRPGGGIDVGRVYQLARIEVRH